jgi:DNA-directed RNA polymerase specialized sigma24 family protein
VIQIPVCPAGRPAAARRPALSPRARTRTSRLISRPISRPTSNTGLGRHLADPVCWEALVARLQRPLRRRVTRALWLAAGLPPSDERVDDLVQEVYCRLFDEGGRRLRLYRGSNDHQLEAFLGRTAERVVADELRRARAWKRRGRPWAPPRPGEPVFTAGDPHDPEQRLLRKENHRLVLAALRRALPAATGARDVWILRQVLVEGWNSREVSRSLGGRLAPSSVDSLVCRLRRRLAASAGIDLPKRNPRRTPRRALCAAV